MLQKPLIQVCGTQSSKSAEEDDFGLNYGATDRSISVVPNSQPPTPPSNQETTARARANPWSAQSSTKKVEPLQIRLGFEDDVRAYYDFRVYHLSFKLTLDLVAYSYG